MEMYLWILHSISLLFGIIGFMVLVAGKGSEDATPQAIGVWFAAAGVFAIAASLSP